MYYLLYATAKQHSVLLNNDNHLAIVHFNGLYFTLSHSGADAHFFYRVEIDTSVSYPLPCSSKIINFNLLVANYSYCVWRQILLHKYL